MSHHELRHDWRRPHELKRTSTLRSRHTKRTAENRCLSHHDLRHEVVHDDPGLLHLVGEVVPQGCAQSGDQGFSHYGKMLCLYLLYVHEKTMPNEDDERRFIEGRVLDVIGFTCAVVVVGGPSRVAAAAHVRIGFSQGGSGCFSSYLRLTVGDLVSSRGILLPSSVHEVPDFLLFGAADVLPTRE